MINTIRDYLKRYRNSNNIIFKSSFYLKDKIYLGILNLKSDKLTKQGQLSPKLPSFIQLEPTTRCNLDCQFCTRKDMEKSRLNVDLSLEDFKSIVEQLPNLKEVKLQGMGEPFMHPNLEEILKYGKSKGISFSTISNGILINKHFDKLEYFDEVCISIDSLKNDSKIKSETVAKKVFKNIEELVHLRNLNKWNTKISINSVISHENYNEMETLLEIKNNLKVDSLIITEVENWNIPSEKSYKESIKFIREARKYSNKITQFKKEHGIEGGDSKIRVNNCWWILSSCYISVDLYVTPCCLRTNPRVFNFGNLRKETFLTIWHSEKYKDFRKAAIYKNEKNGICNICPN